ARRTSPGGWELVVIRYGRLAGTAVVPPHTDPHPAIESLRQSAEHVEPPVAPAPAGHPEEADLLLTWLEQPGVRLVATSQPWTCPVRGADAFADAAEAVAAAVGSAGSVWPVESAEPAEPTEPAASTAAATQAAQAPVTA
ncbi:MAG TPA: endonuclease, partial [Cellulomonas sp.]